MFCRWTFFEVFTFHLWSTNAKIWKCSSKLGKCQFTPPFLEFAHHRWTLQKVFTYNTSMLVHNITRPKFLKSATKHILYTYLSKFWGEFVLDTYPYDTFLLSWVLLAVVRLSYWKGTDEPLAFVLKNGVWAFAFTHHLAFFMVNTRLHAFIFSDV